MYFDNQSSVYEERVGEQIRTPASPKKALDDVCSHLAKKKPSGFKKNPDLFTTWHVV